VKALTAHDIVLNPVITEKTLRQAERHNAYTFRVRPSANKVQVRDAIERIFNVKVTGVRIQNYVGKFRRMGRSVGATPNWKKAIIEVKEGDTIEFY